MRTQIAWKACALVPLVALAAAGCPRKGPPEKDCCRPLEEIKECSRWRINVSHPLFKKTSLAFRDCEPDQCGLNGMWFGQGLQFRELHLRKGVFNDEGLAIEEVISPFREDG